MLNQFTYYSRGPWLKDRLSSQCGVVASERWRRASPKMRPKKVSEAYHSLSKEEGLCNIRFKYNIKSVRKLYIFYGRGNPEDTPSGFPLCHCCLPLRHSLLKRRDTCICGRRFQGAGKIQTERTQADDAERCHDEGSKGM